MIETALDRLTEEGLLSEARYLESFVSYRARSGYGPARIREELSQRGLQRADIDLALRECGISWQAQLEDTWRRKFSGHLPIDARERAKQGRFLSYRGFSMEMISRLLSGRDMDD
ncbi:Regulatory protein RecX [Pseudomonas sp. 24 E 1]|nr:Regulatory protein RecX [Pseudomonas sp. 24 E 1]